MLKRHYLFHIELGTTIDFKATLPTPVPPYLKVYGQIDS